MTNPAQQNLYTVSAEMRSNLGLDYWRLELNNVPADSEDDAIVKAQDGLYYGVRDRLIAWAAYSQMPYRPIAASTPAPASGNGKEKGNDNDANNDMG